MPADRVRIENVTKIPTKRAETHEFTVYAARMDATGFAMVFRTLNPWKASLCDSRL